MIRKLFTGLLTALLALAVGLTCAMAETVLPDVPALDLDDTGIDIVAIEAGVPQVTYRVENGELIAEGEITNAYLNIDGPDGNQYFELVHHTDDDTWRAPCESLNIENGFVQLSVWSNDYFLAFWYYDMDPVSSSWRYTEPDSNTEVYANASDVEVFHPQKYRASYDVLGKLDWYSYSDSDSTNDDVLFTAQYDAEGNLQFFYMQVYAEDDKSYSWSQHEGWKCEGSPCDPPAGYENLTTAEDMMALMPPLVVVEQPEQPQVNLPDKPALNLSDMDIDFAAIEERLPQGTYRVENGELIVEGNDNVTSVDLQIATDDGWEFVELTYHRADGTWRAPCERLEIENGYAEIRLNGENCEFSYGIKGDEISSSWSYTIDHDITISGGSDHAISVSYDSAKYSAHYNPAGELGQYSYSDKTYDEINRDEDKIQTISYDLAGNVLWFSVEIFEDGSSECYAWYENEGWTTLYGDPCEAPAGYENLKTAEDFKTLMPPMVEKPEPVKPKTTWFPHNTLCAAGFYLKDEFPGLTDKWYNVVPVDLSHDGTTVIPLVASGANILGSATVQVKGDKVTVTYDLKNYMKHIYNESECLCWFTSVSDITTEFLNNPTPNAQFGKAVSISEDLNGQDVALLFICNRVLYRLPLDDKGTMPARYWSNSAEWVKYRENLRPLLEMVP